MIFEFFRGFGHFFWQNHCQFKKLSYLCNRKTETNGNDSVAQLVEQLTLNQWVEGSSPSGVTHRSAAIDDCRASFFSHTRFLLSPSQRFTAISQRQLCETGKTVGNQCSHSTSRRSEFPAVSHCIDCWSTNSGFKKGTPRATALWPDAFQSRARPLTPTR